MLELQRFATSLWGRVAALDCGAGLVHFAVGYILTYAAFVIASTSGKYG
jgi:hypothetical protein